ncbi:hypothetical protein A4G99_16105 [Haladaptatus sp. R4]|uniref:HEPN domain-containing protein n=1 Tax=Haladaptatus sp. R4 TaxID=1679489 RepID=UPI0007B4B4A9|nr:HEPN domain-containing protein [Haladaptatus sp. R4]KZN23041.1 hypothetical protein A4G99_16105 [Haladaptatus sp. R4]
MFDKIKTATDSEVHEVLGHYMTKDISLIEAAIELSAAPETLREILDYHDIDVREPTKEELVQDAAECLEPSKHGDGYQYSSTDEGQLEETVSAIIERINVELDQFQLSEGGLRRQIKGAIWEAKTGDGDTADVFWSEMDDIHRYLGTQDRSTYNIVFPLNVIYDDIEHPDEYRVLGETVEALTDDVWETCSNWAYDCEKEKAEKSDVIGDRNKLEEWFKDSPNQLDRGGQTYWMVEIEALDNEYATDRCIAVLRFLLGRINFALSRNQLEGMQMNSSIWNTRWMDLRLPFVYLIFEDNKYSHFSYSRDPTPRKSVKLFGHKADRYDNYLDDIPPLSDNRDTMENRLVKAVHSFQDAVTDTEAEDAFLNYWRAAESLTLTSETDTTSTVVQRARTVARTSNVVSQSKICEKRNKLVHEGESVEITTDDTNTVKDMVEALIILYVNKSSDWSHDDFLFFFEHGDKSDAALGHLKEERLSNIDMIEEILQRN